MRKKPEMTEEQQKEREINELIMTEDNIEMTAHLENCPECQQGGVKGTLKIFLTVSDRKCDFRSGYLIRFVVYVLVNRKERDQYEKNNRNHINNPHGSKYLYRMFSG